MAARSASILLSVGAYLLNTNALEPRNNLVNFVGSLNHFTKGAKCGTLVWRYTPPEAKIKWIRCFHDREGNIRNAAHIFSYGADGAHFKGKLNPGGNFTLGIGLFRLIVPHPRQEEEFVYSCQVEFTDYDQIFVKPAFLSEKGNIIRSFEGYMTHYETGDRESALVWKYRPPTAALDTIHCFAHEDPKDEAIHILTYKLSNQGNSLEILAQRIKFSLGKGVLTLIIIKPTPKDEGLYLCQLRSMGNTEVLKTVGQLKRTVHLQSVHGENNTFDEGAKEGSVLWKLYPINADISEITCYKKSLSTTFEFVCKCPDTKNMQTCVNGKSLKGRLGTSLQKGKFVLKIDFPDVQDSGMYLCLFNWNGNPDTPRLVYSNFIFQALTVRDVSVSGSKRTWNNMMPPPPIVEQNEQNWKSTKQDGLSEGHLSEGIITLYVFVGLVPTVLLGVVVCFLCYKNTRRRYPQIKDTELMMRSA